jgi:hypothetical protein
MRKFAKASFSAALAAAFLAGTGFGQTMTPELKAKVEARAKQLQGWSTDPVIVAAVKAHNASPPAGAKDMTQEKWKQLSILDPFVRSFNRNPLGQYLKSRQDGEISECFVSGADGTKVAFLAKTTNWTHIDKDKHKVPMTGKTWIGPEEVDESSGQLQVQVGLPVWDGGKPIGSIVVGLSVAKLK